MNNRLESLLKLLSITLSDHADFSELLDAKIILIKYLSDQINFSENISKKILPSLSDNISLNESLIKNTYKSLTDDISFSEQLTKGIIVALIDALNFSESSQGSSGKILSDIIYLSELFSAELPILSKSLQDNVLFSDTLMLNIKKFIEDYIDLSDSEKSKVNKLLNDTISLSESFSLTYYSSELFDSISTITILFDEPSQITISKSSPVVKWKTSHYGSVSLAASSFHRERCPLR